MPSSYKKNINVSSINTGTKIPIDQSIYPKKPGILTPFSSAMDLTIKLGALPIYVPAPINTAPQDIAVRSEVALVGNMARTIKDKEVKSKFMRQYNDILNEIAELPRIWFS